MANRYLRRTPGSVIERFVLKQRRKKLARFFFDQYKGVVQKGPFKGMQLDPEVHWGKGDLASKLFGFYELEVLQSMQGFEDRRTLVNLGAADGYYGIGAVYSGMFDRSICFDISPLARKVTRNTAILNGVSDQIEILGEAKEDFIDQIAEFSPDTADVVLISDIEGAEFDVFSDAIVEQLKEAVVIIELHGFLLEDGEEKERALIERFSNHHEVKVLTTGARDTSGYPDFNDLDDNDRWLVCSEGRKGQGRWLYATPTAIKH